MTDSSRGNPIRRRRPRLTSGSIIPLLSGVCLAGCATPPPALRFQVFDTRDLSQFEVVDAASVVSPQTVCISAAANETISFCVVIRSPSAEIESPGLSIGPIDSLAGRLSEDAFDIFRLLSVRTPPLPGWHIRSIPPNERTAAPLDVLVPIDAPRGGLPGRLEPDRAYYFWIDVTIPKETNEGTYTTTLDLYAGTQPVAHQKIELTVLPLVLPDDSGTMFIGELDHRSLFRSITAARSDSYTLGMDHLKNDNRRAELQQALVSTLRLLQSHGVTPVLHKLAPVAKMNARDGLSLDWSQYDTIVEPILDGRIFADGLGVGAWPIPPLPQAERLVTSSGRRHISESANRLARDYLAGCARHFAKKGWLARNYWIPQTPSPLSQDGLDRFNTLAALARRAHPGLRVVSMGCPQDLRPYGKIDAAMPEPSDPTDIWMPPARYYDPAAMQEQRQRSRKTWIALDEPPYLGAVHVAAPPSYTRALGWMMVSLDARALNLGCVNDWPEGDGSPTPETCASKNPNVLLYPGRAFGLRHPVASVRLKRLRRAAQDLSIRRLLLKKNLDHVAQTLESTLVAYAGSKAYRAHYADGRAIGWADDEAQYDRARRIMLDALLSPEHGPSNATASAFETTTDWRRLMSKARSVHLSVDGCNARYTGTSTEWQVALTCTVTITNRLRTPAGGRLRFANTPPGWDDSGEGKQLAAIPPNGSRRAVLTISSKGFSLRTGGVVDLPIEMLLDGGRLVETTARVSFATAIPFSGPAVVDGDLSDWAPGSVNMAGDFRLITGGPRDTLDDRDTHPRARTIAFFRQDEHFLYVAVNTELDERDLALQQQRNAVSYDGLTPIGEPLVEILIDPLNTGTRSPADLYHLVIKPSGAHLSERGVGLSPPVGERTAWASDVEVGTKLLRGRWMTELRIPWSSFADVPRQNSIWGFNITRYDAGTQQYSTWSGSVGNAYDPVSLGNVFIPSVSDRRR